MILKWTRLCIPINLSGKFLRYNMNEQALALYQYALEFAYENVGKEDSDKPYFQAIVAGKFAELIVKECIFILEKPSAMKLDPTTLTPYSEGWVNGRLLGIDHIKEYFGVK